MTDPTVANVGTCQICDSTTNVCFDDYTCNPGATESDSMYCLKDKCGVNVGDVCDAWEVCDTTFNQCTGKPCTESIEGSGNLDTCIETGVCIDGVCAECSTDSGLPETCSTGLYCDDDGTFNIC